jgi:hypothetical protein
VQPVSIRSARLLVNGLVSAGILVALGAWGLTITGRLAVVPVVFLLGGLALAAVTLADVPHTARFDERGIERVCALRRHRLGWDDVAALERPVRGRGAVGAISRGLVLGSRAVEVDGPKKGGLVARVGARRRFLLISRQENPLEHEQLKLALRQWAPWLTVPGAKAAPDQGRA